MVVKIAKKTIIFDTYDNMVIVPRDVKTTEEEVDNYILEHPFPSNDIYTAYNLKEDLKSSSSWILPNSIPKEVIEWLETFLNNTSY